MSERNLPRQPAAGREDALAILEALRDTAAMFDASVAERVARAAHRGQTDQTGRAYIHHVEEAAAGVADEHEDIRVAAWLHDVVEDTGLTLDDLLGAGLSPEAAAIVDAVTHRAGETPQQYLDRIIATPGAPALKRSDVASNTQPERVALLSEEAKAWFSQKYGYVLGRLSEAGY